MKKSIFKAFLVWLIFTLSVASCTGQSGGQTINSPEALKTYLDRQTDSQQPDKPIRVSMTINDQMLENVAEVIKSSGKYVSLNITGDLLKTIGDGDFWGCETLVSVTILLWRYRLKK